jgi:hypothetical protein
MLCIFTAITVGTATAKTTGAATFTQKQSLQGAGLYLDTLQVQQNTAILTSGGAGATLFQATGTKVIGGIVASKQTTKATVIIG